MENASDLPKWVIRTNAQLSGFVVREVDEKDSVPHARLRRFHGNVRKIVSDILKEKGLKIERSTPKTYLMAFRGPKEDADFVDSILREALIGIVQECPRTENDPAAFIMPQVDLKNSNLTAEA